jgi:hypothetical protein
LLRVSNGNSSSPEEHAQDQKDDESHKASSHAERSVEEGKEDRKYLKWCAEKLLKYMGFDHSTVLETNFRGWEFLRKLWVERL